jgi:hypothetical protein
MRWFSLVVWAAFTALLGWGGEMVDPSKRFIMMGPVMMLWMPLTLIMALIWNPRHRLYW